MSLNNTLFIWFYGSLVVDGFLLLRTDMLEFDKHDVRLDRLVCTLYRM